MVRRRPSTPSTKSSLQSGRLSGSRAGSAGRSRASSMSSSTWACPRSSSASPTSLAGTKATKGRHAKLTSSVGVVCQTGTATNKTHRRLTTSPTDSTLHRLLDLLLLKKDIGHYALTDKLEQLALSLEVKAALRTILSSVASYRSAMGEPHFDDTTGVIRLGKPVDQVDLTWRGTMGILGRMFLELFEAGRQINTHTSI